MIWGFQRWDFLFEFRLKTGVLSKTSPNSCTESKQFYPRRLNCTQAEALKVSFLRLYNNQPTPWWLRIHLLSDYPLGKHDIDIDFIPCWWFQPRKTMSQIGNLSQALTSTRLETAKVKQFHQVSRSIQSGPVPRIISSLPASQRFSRDVIEMWRKKLQSSQVEIYIPDI